MVGCRHDSEANTLLRPFSTVHKPLVCFLEDGTFQPISQVIAEGGEVIELRRIGFQRPHAVGQRTALGGPTFTVEQHSGIEGAKFGAEHVHGLDVVNSHEVETEAVDVIFRHPVAA